MKQKVIYRKKPKHLRRPPVWKHQVDVEPLTDAILEIYLTMKNHDPGYMQRGIVSNYRHTYANSLSIHVNPGKSVTMLQQEHVVRWNHKAQKHFLADETLMVRTVYLTSQNRVAYYFYNVFYDAAGKRHKSHISPMMGDLFFADYGLDLLKYAGTENIDPISRWRAIAEKEFGQSIAIEAVYPGIEFFGRSSFKLIGSKAMRCDNAADATRIIFGKKYYRRDMVRAVGKKMTETTLTHRAHVIAWVELFKKSVPTDWLVAALNHPHREFQIVDIEYGDVATITPFGRTVFHTILDHLRPAERRNILMNTVGVRHGQIFHDTLRTYQQLERLNARIPDNRNTIKSIHDLHNLLIREVTRINREQTRIRNENLYNANNMLINKQSFDEQFAFMLELDPRIDIRFARDYDTLAGWSDYMVNCISSYFSQTCLLAGIYQDGELVANMEIRPRFGNAYEVHQLLGKHNQKLDPGLKVPILAILNEYGVNVSFGFWG